MYGLARSFLHRSQRSHGVSIQFVRCHRRIASLFENKPVGTKTSVQGWVKAVRSMKKAVFLELGDGSSSRNLQVVVVKNNSGLAMDEVKKLERVGTAVEVFGEIKSHEKNIIELHMESATVLGDGSIENYPFQPRVTHPLDHVRQYPHLRPRTAYFGSVLRIRDTASRAFRDHLLDEDYIEVNTPVLTSCDCEGAGEVFTVQPNNISLMNEMKKLGQSPDEAFFNTKAYLTVSGQLHLECAARALCKVYSLGPIFRAENSKSRLHLSEFYMLETESIFTRSLDDLMSSMERMLRNVTKTILNEKVSDILKINEIQHLQNKLPSAEQVDPITEEKIASTFLSEEPYKVMTYSEAVDFLLKISEVFKVQPRHDQNLAKEHELCLVKHNNNRPVFLIDWPSEMKPFYMKNASAEGKVSAVDLLVPIVGELCGGSLREDDYTVLEERMKRINLNDKLSWYLDLRKYGNVPSGGFGMGFERYLQCLLCTYNIKDVIPFPRSPHSCAM